MSDSLSSLTNAVEQADSATALTEAVQNLADACFIDSIPILIEALSYNNPGAAVAAVDGLIQLGEPAVPRLLEQLDINNYTARSWTIRALAGIGDPRGLVTLLGAATADFSMSVRRAAAKGLGNMNWHRFPHNLLEIVQGEALDALLFVAQNDEEWVVRYAAVVGLESLVLALASIGVSGQTKVQGQLDLVQEKLELMSVEDASLSVRARVWKAQQHFQEMLPRHLEAANEVFTIQHQPLPTTDWEKILEKLYSRKLKERVVVIEGDPSNYRELVNMASTMQ